MEHLNFLSINILRRLQWYRFSPSRLLPFPYAMDTLLFSPSSSSAYPSLKAPSLLPRNGFWGSRTLFSDFPNVCSSFCTLNPPTGFARKSVVVAAKKTNSNKDDGHRSVPKPDETTGFFPEAVLLKEVQF